MEVEQHTEALLEQIKPLSMLGESLSRNLSEIRELIKQARKQAASVHTNSHPHQRPRTHTHVGVLPW